MFIKAKNLGTGREINLNVRNIVAFEPSDNEGTSRVELSNGRVVTIDLSNDMIRDLANDELFVSGEPAPEPGPEA